MVNWDLLSIFVFYGILIFLYYRYKDKFETQGIVILFKTTWGLSGMQRIAGKFPRLSKLIASLGVIVGFLGMAFMLYVLTVETWKLIFVAGTEPALAPVLPGVEIPGAPVLSFWHWIITIFIAAGVHEFSHGVAARVHNIKVKSSGFAFFGPIMGAFVEPDQKQMDKKSQWAQLSVFAAGPWANFILGGLVILFLTFAFAPGLSAIYESTGVTITDTVEGYPMNATGIATPFTIYSINEEETLSFDQFVGVTEDISPGDTITLDTSEGEYSVTTVENPEDNTKAFIGISGFTQEQDLVEGWEWVDPFTGALSWVYLLLVWLFLINIGIGLFNLLPLGPIDGGRMFYSLMLVIFPKKKTLAKNLFVGMSVFCLGLLIINLIPWLYKLVVWIGSGLSLLLALV